MITAYEYFRLFERDEKNNNLWVTAYVRKVQIDTAINPPKETHYAEREHSLRFPLDNIPRHIQLLSPVDPTRLSVDEFIKVRRMHDDDFEGFLFYEPRGC